MVETLRIFVAKGCAPCEQIEEAIDKGRVDVDGLTVTEARETDIEVVDVTSDEGFPLVEQFDLDGVPAAYYGMRQCSLLVDEDRVTVDCSETESPSDRSPVTPPS